MEYIFYLFIILVIWHFVYQAILLPSFRLKLRFEFFSLRDKLRLLKIRYKSDINDNLYHYLHDQINSNLHNLHYLDFGLLYEAYIKLKNDSRFNKVVEDRMNLFKNCQVDEIKDIHSEIADLFLKALVTNSGGWTIYIIPPSIIFLLFKGIKNLVNKITFIPERDIDKLFIDKGALT